ncbi:MAG TPA: PAS domain S-box protein, partial [Deferrisomatales bacterium]|nr:PAS domain S-box protein [Deferrisomatales bacterium]
MESLSRLLSDGADWLFQRTLEVARDPGLFPPHVQLPAGWQASVADLARSLGEALATTDGPAPDSNHDPVTCFAVEHARWHREHGATLAATLRLLKLQRQCCRDLVAEAALDERPRLRSLDALERTFDRMELAFCLEWSVLEETGGEETGGRDRLELLKALSDRVRAGLPTGQVIAFAVSELARRFADHRVAYARLGNGTRLQVLQSSQPPGLADLSGEEFDLSAHPGYLTELRSFMPVLSEDVSADPLYGALGTQLARGGAGATFDLPVRSGQELAGVLCVAAGQPHPWDQKLVRLLTQVGEILNGACEREARENAERALRETSLWLRGMFQALEEAVFLLTPARELVDCNPAAERMFQYSRQELEYLSAAVLHLDRDHYQRFGAIMDAAFARNESATFEFRFKRRNGEIFPTEQTVALLRGDGGESVGVLAVVRDITERRRAEDALRDSEQRLLQIIDFLPDPTWVIDGEGRVVAWNRAIEAVTGVPSEEIVGEGDYAYAVPFYGCRRPVLIDLVSRPAPEWEASYLEFRRDGERLTSESFHPHLGDGGLYLASNATPLYDGEGMQVGAIETVRDATARRRAEDELRRREQQYRTFFE